MWDPTGDSEATKPVMPQLPTDSSPEPPSPDTVGSPPRSSAFSTIPEENVALPILGTPAVTPPPIPQPQLDNAVMTVTPAPPTRRRAWPLLLLALLTVGASGAVSWFVATSVADDSNQIAFENLDGGSADVTEATPITGNTIEPTPLETAPTIPDASAEFLANEPFAAAAAKIAPSVVQLTLENGLGSGVIIDESGVILTAAHVVGTNTELDVRLFDGSTVEGTVIGTHGPTDVAVVLIDGENLDLVVAPLADGDEVRVGQLAVAVGSPFGFEQTVTAGIISAVDRIVNNVSMVQTDAPINPGNSGGPLIDLEGRVVGINDLIFTESGSNAGVGFAISIDLAMVVAEQLVAGEEVQLALLGVTSGPSPDGAAGALIDQIVEGSAAEAAGFEVGDLVISVDGVATRGSSGLRAQVIDNPPGTELRFGVIRDDVRIELRAVLGSTG